MQHPEGQLRTSGVPEVLPVSVTAAELEGVLLLAGEDGPSDVPPEGARTRGVILFAKILESNPAIMLPSAHDFRVERTIYFESSCQHSTGRVEAARPEDLRQLRAAEQELNRAVPGLAGRMAALWGNARVWATESIARLGRLGRQLVDIQAYEWAYAVPVTGVVAGIVVGTAPSRTGRKGDVRAVGIVGMFQSIGAWLRSRAKRIVGIAVFLCLAIACAYLLSPLSPLGEHSNWRGAVALFMLFLPFFVGIGFFRGRPRT